MTNLTVETECELTPDCQEPPLYEATGGDGSIFLVCESCKDHVWDAYDEAAHVASEDESIAIPQKPTFKRVPLTVEEKTRILAERVLGWTTCSEDLYSPHRAWWLGLGRYSHKFIVFKKDWVPYSDTFTKQQWKDVMFKLMSTNALWEEFKKIDTPGNYSSFDPIEQRHQVLDAIVEACIQQKGGE